MPLSEAELAAYYAKSKLYEEFAQKADKEICAECEGILVVRWYRGAYELVCGKNKSHQGTKSKWKCKAIRERNEREGEYGRDKNP